MPGTERPDRSGSVDLYWLPLGAGGRCVRINGRVFEAVVARHERRNCDLYHSPGWDAGLVVASRWAREESSDGSSPPADAARLP